MRLPSNYTDRVAKEKRERKDKRARDELAAIKRPDELTRLQSELASTKIKLQDANARASLAELDTEEQRTIVALLNDGLVPDSDLWCDLVKERDRLQSENTRLTLELATAREQGNAQAHVLIEHGVIPGLNDSCQCAECRLVAKAMANAGYLDRIANRWWESEAE